MSEEKSGSVVACARHVNTQRPARAAAACGAAVYPLGRYRLINYATVCSGPSVWFGREALAEE